jgi:hypothetical protein
MSLELTFIDLARDLTRAGIKTVDGTGVAA